MTRGQELFEINESVLVIISYTLRAHSSDKLFVETLGKGGMKMEKLWSEGDSSIFKVLQKH